MSDLGKLIHSVRDDEGEIHVYEDARFRYLTFGNLVEQRCLDLANPRRLEHVYTQAMLLGLLLHPRPRQALLLGLGGGSLARALHAADAGLRITAVDSRRAVIDVARSHFQLPDGRRLQVQCADAAGFVSASAMHYDLILGDLYDADGMHPVQTREDFLAACRARLAGDGILVLNQWASEYADNRATAQVLQAVFDGQVLNLHVQGGNIISFALPHGLPRLDRETFFAAAQALGLRVDVPLQRLARNLWRQNAEILQVGRFAYRRRD